MLEKEVGIERSWVKVVREVERKLGVCRIIKVKKWNVLRRKELIWENMCLVI